MVDGSYGVCGVIQTEAKQTQDGTPHTTGIGRTSAALLWHYTPDYTTTMLNIYNKVTAPGQHNYVGTHMALPTNWEVIAKGYHDMVVIQNLKCGPIPTPSSDNHSSAKQYASHVNACVCKDVAGGAPLLGIFSKPPFTPWA